MTWKVIKRGLFVTLEGLEKEGNEGICNDYTFEECRTFDTYECIDYWIICWEKFRVKVFNKVKYEGHNYHSAEYTYDISEMKHLLIIAGILWSLAIILILNLVLNI